MPEHHPYDHSIPAWGWVLIVICLAMLAGLLVHVVVDHGKGLAAAHTGNAALAVDGMSAPSAPAGVRLVG